MSARKRRRRAAWALLALLALSCAASLLLSAYGLTCTRYTLSSAKLPASVRVVQLTDLHNSVFGADNARLVRLVREQEPDLILITGDLLNAAEEGTDIATDLISALVALAPVYVSLGNHELEHQRRWGTDIPALYTAAGATVLDRDYADVDINGAALRIGGIYGYCMPEKYLRSGEAKQDECAFLADFQGTERYTLLLCHMPYAWTQAGGLDAWDVDCVLAGHVHGGEVIFPLLGGAYGPDYGWFPGRLWGLYSSGDGAKTLVLSRGLGTTESVPRFNNIPEVVAADLTPET